MEITNINETNGSRRVDVTYQNDGNIKIEECQLENLGSHNSLDHLEFGKIGTKLEKLEDVIKNEMDDIKLEDEEVIIKCEDEQELDAHIVNTKVEELIWSLDHGSRTAEHDQKHMLVQESSDSLFKCAECSFESKYKQSVNQHILVHKDPSKIKMFKCYVCRYQSQQIRNLKKHMLVHADPSQIKMFKCNECSYESKRNHDLKVHMLVHDDPSQVKMYKCYECSFKSKHKRSLKPHMLVHKDPSQIQMFKCKECSYASKRRTGLREHLLLHGYSSQEVEEWIWSLKDGSKIPEHDYKHMSVQERSVSMFKCNECRFESKYKQSLKRHILVHKDPSIQIFECNKCSYRSKYKSYFKMHMLAHEDPSQIKKFKCNECSFESKRKWDLKQHMLVHEDPTQIQKFK